MYRLRVISRRTNFRAARPDPNRPRYEDPGQNAFRSEKQFKEETTKELKYGDKKRLLPLKTLVPEEYRGARYYTDREMEFVDPKNSKMRLFGGPYSLFFPHKDGRIECEGDRVPCNYSIKRSLKYGDPLVIDPLFQDQSRYGKAKRYPRSNPRRNDEIRSIYMKVLGFVSLCFVIWRYSGIAQAFGYQGALALDFSAAGYTDLEKVPIGVAIWVGVLISVIPLTYGVQATKTRFVRLLAKLYKRPMSAGERYSFSLTTFSPSGKLVQIEYALNAVNAGQPTVGIKAKDGTVIATEKKHKSTLQDETTYFKVEKITNHIGMVYAGMGPDYRVLVTEARKAASVYSAKYGEPIPTEQLVMNLATVMQSYTQMGGVRPFGCSLLIIGKDELSGPMLYQCDPSGCYFPWKATALGKNYHNARSFLERRYNEELELDDAVHTAILTLKESFEGQMNEHNIEIGICDSNGFKRLDPSEVKDYLGSLA